jgi:hypothetical protein
MSSEEQKQIILETLDRSRDEYKIKNRVQILRDQENRKLQAEWVHRCVVPFTPMPTFPRPKLDFGLAVFIAYAKWMHRQYGDQAAASTLRVILGSGRKKG